MGLDDFRPDKTSFDDVEDSAVSMDSTIETSGYQEEINTLKIDKLSNRVTIISIMIPCMVFAILAFAYIDMKERVVDVDTTKQNQVETISRQLEEKINTLDVRIAKNRYDLDTTLPEIKKKQVALEGQLAGKASSRDLSGEMTKIDRRIKANVKESNKRNVETLAVLNQSQAKMDAATSQIKNDIVLFKEEFDARLLELSEYEQQIGELRKDLSLVDKRLRSMAADIVKPSEILTLSQEITRLSKELDLMESEFETRLNALGNKISQLMKKQSQTAVPQQNKPDNSSTPAIKKQPLSQ